MSKSMCRAALAVLILGVSVSPALSQGIFDQQADWGPRGANKVPGSVAVTGSGASAVYNLAGNGDDIWNNDDEGFFVYTEEEGSMTLSGQFTWVETGGNEWAKLGPMVREDGASATSVNYAALARGMMDLVSPQWRAVDGAASSSHSPRMQDENGNTVALENGSIWLRVSRIAPAQAFLSEWSRDGVTWHYGHSIVLPMADSVAYGIAITNHDDNTVLATGTASSVELTPFDRAVGVRSVSNPSITQGESVDVTINLFLNPSTTTVTETLPEGWTATNVSDGGTASGNVITWTDVSSAVTELTYTANAPANTQTTSFGGFVGDLTTFGTSSLALLQAGMGLFDAHADIGPVGIAGDAEMDGDTYIVTGSGADIWGSADQFHFLFTEMTEGFSIRGTAFLGLAGEPTWTKGGLMIRDSLEPGAANAFNLVRSEADQIRYQARPTTGAESVGDLDQPNTVQEGEMELVRVGNRVFYYYYNLEGEQVHYHTAIIPDLQDPVYVGLAVTSHDNNMIAELWMEDVSITEFPFTVIREISSYEVVPGGSSQVTVTVDPREGQSVNFTVEENAPATATISNVQASEGSANESNGTITWTGSGVSANATLTYTLTFAADASGGQEISGSFDNGAGFSNTISTDTIEIGNFDVTDLGIFAGNTDVGAVAAEGTVGKAGETWLVVGSGADIWGTADEFHYLYLRANGDFTMSIEDAQVTGFGGNPSSNDWQKVGIMARQSLDAGSTYAYSMLRSLDHNLYLQWRDEGVTAAGIPDAEIVTEDLHQGNIGLERSGDDFISFYFDSDGNRVDQSFHFLPMTDPIYVGVAVTSHQDGSLSVGSFNNVQFNGTAVPVGEWMLH